MNTFDICVLTSIGIITLHGLGRGATDILLSTASGILSILLAVFLYPMISAVASNHLDNAITAQILAVVGSYLAAVVVTGMVSSSLKRILHPVSQGMINSLLGGVIGFLKAVSLNILVFLAIGIFNGGHITSIVSVRDLLDRIDASDYPAWMVEGVCFDKLYATTKALTKLVPDHVLSKKLLPNQNIFETVPEPSKKGNWHKEISRQLEELIQ